MRVLNYCNVYGRSVLRPLVVVGLLSSLAIAQPKGKANEPQPAPVASPTPAGTTTEPAPAIDPATVPNESVPDTLRIRRLEQRVQALKERAWRSKAKISMLQESMLGGGIGAQAMMTHANNMGSAFRLVKLVYSLDGTQVFARTDETGEVLYKTAKFDVFAGPISPSSHSVSVLAVYRGNGYGVFKYLNKYTFQVRSSHTFNAVEGRTVRLEANAYEKGGASVPLEKRPVIEFTATNINAEKIEKPASSTPAAGK